MKDHIRKFLPCVLLSILTGLFTGGLIFLFKIASGEVMHLAAKGYAFVRENPIWLPVLILAVAVLGLLASLILKHAKECRGGGIPTAVVSIRGLAPMKWLQGIFGVFASSLLSYLGGVPLGNEGPSVQMGAAVGKGTVSIFGKRTRAWERYVMSGGACAGFAAATGAPLTGILFAVEEAHRRFSPMIFMVAAISVFTGMATQQALEALFCVESHGFFFGELPVLPMKMLWIAAAVGAACGLCAMAFAKLYQVFKGSKWLKKLPFTVKIVMIFIFAAILGFCCEDFIGSGASLVEKILSGGSVWYWLLAALAVRGLMLILSNTQGVTGGAFIPTLAFGAILAALVAKVCGAEGEYFGIFVAVGMAAFLAALSRTPIMALLFAAEALCGIGNILPVGVGVAVAYLLVEVSGITAFTDSVIESKAEAAREDKKLVVVDEFMTVRPGSFACGREVRDILWPPACTVLSVRREGQPAQFPEAPLQAGDVLHLYYRTWDEKESREALEDILGVSS